jgi:chemotaxis protein CheX
MLGEEYTKIDQELVNGAGELTKMIFGQVKIVLNEKGYGIKTTIPSVISGKDHSLSALTKGPSS